MNPEELLERTLTALKGAMTPGDMGSSILNPEKADRFIRIVGERTPMLMEARRLPMNSNKRDIDRVGFTGRILDAPSVYESDDTNDKKVSTYTNQLEATEVMAAAGLKDATIEEVIEKENFTDTLIDLIGGQVSRDLQNWFLNADKDGGGGAFFQLIDGWLELAANQVTGVASADFDPTDVEAMFEACMLAVPEKYLEDPERWRFYVRWAVAHDLRKKYRARGTDLGDAAQTRNIPLTFEGVPVVVVPHMPADGCLFAPPDNLVYGIYRDVRIEPDRIPRKRQTDFIVTLRGDAHYEDENAAAVATGYTGP